jgi:hypothetical protein
MRPAGTGAALGMILCIGVSGCRSRPEAPPSIEFTHLPPAGDGSPDMADTIEGRVTGAHPKARVVLFARSGLWWVQPLTDQPFTTLQADSTWKNSTHPGSGYAALLVTPDYRPPATLKTLPERGGPVLAVAVAEGSNLERRAAKIIDFSGYQWQLREASSSYGGNKNQFDSANAWTDQQGLLHLHIAGEPGQPGQPGHWTSAEARLIHSLGYGSYRFVVRGISQLEPAAVFSMVTWDDLGPPREMDIEVSQWGEPTSKNAQFVVQPYFVPANVVRFMAPAGTLTFWIQWEPGRVSFKTVRGSTDRADSNVVAEHAFTSGVPLPGDESIRMTLYVFDNKKAPLQHPSEVIVEKFEYLP